MGVPLTKIVISPETGGRFGTYSGVKGYVYQFANEQKPGVTLIVHSDKYIDYRKEPIFTDCAMLVRETNVEFEGVSRSVTYIHPFPSEEGFKF